MVFCRATEKIPVKPGLNGLKASYAPDMRVLGWTRSTYLLVKTKSNQRRLRKCCDESLTNEVGLGNVNIW